MRYSLLCCLNTERISEIPENELDDHGVSPCCCPYQISGIFGQIGTRTDHSTLDIRCRCINVDCMTVVIQIRNVPDALHRRLKSRAALADKSLSDYLLDEIRFAAEWPTIDEMRARLERRTKVAPSITPAQAVRLERDRQ
jgi:antitoxin FitA